MKLPRAGLTGWRQGAVSSIHLLHLAWRTLACKRRRLEAAGRLSQRQGSAEGDQRPVHYIRPQKTANCAMQLGKPGAACCCVKRGEVGVPGACSCATPPQGTTAGLTLTVVPDELMGRRPCLHAAGHTPGGLAVPWEVARPAPRKHLTRHVPVRIARPTLPHRFTCGGSPAVSEGQGRQHERGEQDQAGCHDGALPWVAATRQIVKLLAIAPNWAAFQPLHSTKAASQGLLRSHPKSAWCGW